MFYFSLSFIKCNILFCKSLTTLVGFGIVCLPSISTHSYAQNPENFNRNNYLKELQELNRAHPTASERPRDVYASFVRLSFMDSTWDAWQQRTGELPPDFQQMPDIPFLPDPMIWDEGRQNVSINTPEQWDQNGHGFKSRLKPCYLAHFLIRLGRA